MTTHYEKKKSLTKRVRKWGFRARMRTKAGRKLLSRKRKVGRKLSVRRFF